MWFWWFILVCDLLVPFTMLIAGRMMWKHCPKHINGVVGYRTRRSMKNIETWKFAHDYCGQLWWKIGLWMIIPSVLVHVPFYHSDEGCDWKCQPNSGNHSMNCFGSIYFTNGTRIKEEIL